ncbi:Survival motor neuron protein [Amphibalanus amphitrite]|uniref:Survival motor neuron protein n=1 Tax=Amphibalanus amphitrite TaxID=1232801 RepID=A0A6A4WJZ1_AMPAM|nr:Survival motor neuron protein [Amphibalanus amphitrite]
MVVRVKGQRKAMGCAAAEEKPSKKWRIGDFCRAVYSVDGQWYEAEIISVGGARCRLRYVGYGNEEDQPLGRLQPSAGKKERRRQEREAEDEREAQEEGEGGGQEDSEEEDQVPGDADPVQLANMLMSWYISGYHTGYYQASREARK